MKNVFALLRLCRGAVLASLALAGCDGEPTALQDAETTPAAEGEQPATRERRLAAPQPKEDTPAAGEPSKPEGNSAVVNGKRWTLGRGSALINGKMIDIDARIEDKPSGNVVVTIKSAENNNASIQLRYNYTNKELTSVLFQPYVPNAAGKPDRLDLGIGTTTELSGSLSFKEPTPSARGHVSGTASFKAATRDGKHTFEVKDVSFSGVGYSNLFEFDLIGQPKGKAKPKK